MASNYDKAHPSIEQVMIEVSEILAPYFNLNISVNEEKQALSSGPDQSSSSPPDELQILLQRYEESMWDTSLKEKDESTLALAQYYQQARNYDKCLTYSQKLYDIRLQIFGPNSQSEHIASVAHNIWVCLDGLKRYQQSLKWCHEAMSMRETQQPTLNLASSYDAYGVALQKTGQYNEALKYYQKSLQVYNKLTSSDTKDKAITLCNIGDLYKDNLCNYTKSLDYYNKALTMFRNVYGTNTTHVRIAHCLHSIGLAYYNKEDYSKARTFYKDALDEFEKIYHSEPYHDDIETTTSNLGNVCYRAGDYSSAEFYYRELVRIRERKYGRGSRHEELLQAYQALFTAFRGQNRMEEAREIARLHRI